MDITHDELAELMLEHPSGDNHGRTSEGADAAARWSTELGAGAWQAADFTEVSRYERDGVPGVPGTGIVDVARGRGTRGTYGATDAGMTAHRGIVQPGMYVDGERLRRAVEHELGFTADEFRRVAGNGRPRKADDDLRRRINARLAELHAAGANFAVLAPLLGVTPQALGKRAKRFTSHAD